MQREQYWRERVKRYFHTYKALGLGYIWTLNQEKIRNGFLYQEPNPDYDKWYEKNCTPIFFKDWIWDKIPEGMPKPKPGPRSKAGLIRPRPVICIETGKFYISTREAMRDGYPGADTAAKGESSMIFTNDCRFTFVDPFMEWDDKKWEADCNKHFNYISSQNHRVPVLVDGVHMGSFDEAATYLAETTGYARSYIYQNLKKRAPEFKGHKITYSK